MKSFLSEEERTNLKLQHRREKDRRTADRIKTVLLSDKGWTYKAIAEALLLDEETISRHIEEYTSQKKLRINVGGSVSKLNELQTKELLEHLENVMYVKVKDICEYVLEKHGIKYTIPGMTSWLKLHKFSYKKPKETPAKADPIKQEIFKEYYNRLKSETPEEEPILFGDGVHPTMATKVTYGWIRKGKNKPIATTASRTRMNILGSIELNTMRIVVQSFKTIDSTSMERFLEKVKETYFKAKKIHLIVDQGRYNTSEKTRGAAERLGIQLHFLPPYSPNLNPIERLWKVMNEQVRNNRFFKEPKEFREKIEKFFQDTWITIACTMGSRINDNFQKIKSAF